MREIKFRAWDKNESRMIYSGTEQNDYPFAWMIHNSGIDIAEHDGTEWNYLKELIFMQYTGLKDKNGKEIYDGDLVAVADYANWEGLYKIIWDEKNLMYMLEDAFGDREKLCEFEEYLVKGNIYENPELLRTSS